MELDRFDARWIQSAYYMYEHGTSNHSYNIHLYMPP
jgi:hypothetical protein